MKNKSIHLSQDQILLSLVDDNDLSEDIKIHLLGCPACRRKKMAFVLELDRLGEKAKYFAPDVKQNPAFLFQKAQYSFIRRPIYAVGLALVLITVLSLSILLFTDSSKQMTTQLSTEKENYLYLLDEILEEPYLPDPYLDITVASNSYFDDEFVEFIVPMEDPVNSI
jgi:hypothetical protein